MPERTEKMEYYARMAKDASEQITSGWEPWTGFLTVAARLYKYPFADQLMIYKQRPDATACAEYGLWNNTMGRYIKRGSKGIALLDSNGDTPRLRYVFDVSDTGTRRNSRPLPHWEMRDEFHIPVTAALERAFGVAGTDGLLMQLTEIAEILAGDYWESNASELIGILADRQLAGRDDALALEADVHQHLVVLQLDDGAVDEIALVELGQRAVDHLVHLLIGDVGEVDHGGVLDFGQNGPLSKTKSGTLRHDG